MNKYMDKLPESDWKKLRIIRPKALQRQCQKILNELTQLIQESPQTPHETYLEMYQKVHEWDKLIARDFDYWSRSKALPHLFAWIEAGVFTQEEFESLSEATQEFLSRHRTVHFFNEQEKIR